jgi:hypothetical protein
MCWFLHSCNIIAAEAAEGAHVRASRQAGWRASRDRTCMPLLFRAAARVCPVELLCHQHCKINCHVLCLQHGDDVRTTPRGPQRTRTPSRAPLDCLQPELVSCYMPRATQAPDSGPRDHCFLSTRPGEGGDPVTTCVERHPPFISPTIVVRAIDGGSRAPSLVGLCARCRSDGLSSSCRTTSAHTEPKGPDGCGGSRPPQKPLDGWGDPRVCCGEGSSEGSIERTERAEGRDRSPRESRGISRLRTGHGFLQSALRKARPRIRGRCGGCFATEASVACGTNRETTQRASK